MRLLGKTNWMVVILAAVFGLTSFPAQTGQAAEGQQTLIAKAKKKKRAKKATKKRKKKAPKKKFSEVPEFEKKKEPTAAEKPEDAVSTGPAKIKLPMVEERKDAGATLEEELLDKEIGQLKEIVRDTPDGPSKCDLYFRLAERYYEKARAIYYTEMQDYDKNVEAWITKRETDPDAAEPKLDNRKSQVYTDQAMSIYGVILKKCADYHRRDEVLFTMGYNLYESGKKPEGVKMYWELIKNYPDSRFVPDAYLAMGEHYFNSDDVFNAKKAYERALKFTESKVFTFALYKLAWCDYNLGEYEKALEKFKQVVELAQREAQTAGGDKNKIQLRREALQDMIMSFSQIDALDSAEEYYLSQVGKTGALEYLRKLARTYENQGKAEMTVKSFRRLLNEYPTDPDCPSFHNSIVLAYRKMNLRDKVSREINRLIDQYKPGSTWAEVNKSNKMAIKKANSLVEGSLRDLVTSYHKEAQETKSWDTYNLARSIYQKYLETFPDSEYAYKLRWYYSDILYKMRDFYTAAIQYAKVVEKDPKGVYSSEAAYNSVLCWEKCIEMRDDEKKDCREWKPKTGGQKLQKEEAKTIKKQDYRFVDEGVTKDMLVEKEIPFFEKKFLDAADIYSDAAPGHDMYIPIRFKSAFIFYKYRHFSEMAKRFGEIIERHPDNEFALKATKLSLNSLYMKALQKDASDQERNEAWKDINHWAKTFQANKVLMGSAAAKKTKFAGEVQSLIEESGYNVVLALRKVNALAAASGFDKFVNDYPKSKYAHRAQYAAMVIYDEASQLDLAINAGKKLLKDYPESDRYNPTIGFLATFHDRVADFSTSAMYNELYFSKWLAQEGKDEGKSKRGRKAKKARKPKPAKKSKADKGKEKVEVILITEKEASDALYNAGLLRESMGQFNKAIANYTKYIKYFPDKKDAHELFYKIGGIYERQDNVRKADIIYEGYLDKYSDRSSPGRILAVTYKHAMALRKMDKVKESDKLLDQIIEKYNKLDEKARDAEARLAVAHARFLQVEKDYLEYMGLKLVLPPRVLKRNLFKKIELRPKLEMKYEEIVSYADPDWSIASLVRVGQISQDLADAMLEAPVPMGLTPEQADIYVEELQKQALPLEEKAIAFYRKAIEVSSAKGLYNEWSLKAQDLLRKYETAKYPPPYPAGQISTEFFYTAGAELEPVEVPPQPEPAPLQAPGGPAAATEPAQPAS
jgi:tetratricopeptide (TPR) repeat protein